MTVYLVKNYKGHLCTLNIRDFVTFEFVKF